MDITYRPHGSYIIMESKEDGYTTSFWAEVYRTPTIGEKYMVVFYCDYDNSEYGENYIVEVSADNIHEITFRMNDTMNDITEYILLDQLEARIKEVLWWK